MNDNFDMYEPVRRSHKDLPNFTIHSDKRNQINIDDNDRRYFEKEPSYLFIDSIFDVVVIILVLLGILAYVENRDQEHYVEDQRISHSNAIARETVSVRLEPIVLTQHKEETK